MKNFAIRNSKSDHPKFIAMHKVSRENVNKIFESKSHRNWFVTSFLDFNDYRHITDHVSNMFSTKKEMQLSTNSKNSNQH